MDNYYSAINTKLINQKRVLDQGTENQNNPITDSLNTYASNKINKNDELNYELDNRINTGSRIIDINEEEFQYKDKLRQLLMYSLLVVVVIILIFFGSGLRLYNPYIASALIVIIVLLFALYFYYKINVDLQVIGDIKRKQFATENETGANLLKTILPSFITDKGCSKKC